MAEHCTHSHAPADMEELTDKLRAKSLKITGPRQSILEVLRQHPHPLTIKEIRQKLKGKVNCDQATVYRSMHMLVKLGMVKRFDFGDGVARFELVEAQGRHHHHHLVCTECSRIVEIEECHQKEWEQKLSREHGFQQITHNLEFFGVCPDCQKGSSKA